jgi:EAL domain-containing protein (putative c-di-GMP-specific phosphodiesterase class I)
VEDAETMRRLEEMGCDLAQGYFISRAVPAAALMAWLTENSWGLKRT